MAGHSKETSYDSQSVACLKSLVAQANEHQTIQSHTVHEPYVLMIKYPLETTIDRCTSKRKEYDYVSSKSLTSTTSTTAIFSKMS